MGHLKVLSDRAIRFGFQKEKCQGGEGGTEEWVGAKPQSGECLVGR